MAQPQQVQRLPGEIGGERPLHLRHQHPVQGQGLVQQPDRPLHRAEGPSRDQQVRLDRHRRNVHERIAFVILSLLTVVSVLRAGESLSGIVLSDLDDHPVTLGSYGGKVVVLLHEDREASNQNRPFKERLGELAASRAGRLAVVALADVSRYDFWPARRYVKAALARLRDQDKALVLCDWKGVFRRRFHLQAGQSTLFLLRPDGQLELMRRGELSGAEAASVLDRIERMSR